MEHWNIQVAVQRVIETEETPALRAQGKSPIKKSVMQIADLKVQADSEAEAFEKVDRLLTALHPDVVVVPAGSTVEADGFGAYGPIRRVRDNPQA